MSKQTHFFSDTGAQTTTPSESVDELSCHSSAGCMLCTEKFDLTCLTDYEF